MQVGIQWIDWKKALAFEPIKPFWRSCLATIPIALVPSWLLVLSVIGVLLLLGIDPESTRSVSDIEKGAIVYPVIVGPLIETLLLTLGLGILSSFIGSLMVVSCMSAIAWGLLHGYHDPVHFFGPAWGFFVFSYSYLTWRRVSYWQGFLAALIPHACNNLVAVAIGALWP